MRALRWAAIWIFVGALAGVVVARADTDLDLPVSAPQVTGAAAPTAKAPPVIVYPPPPAPDPSPVMYGVDLHVKDTVVFVIDISGSMGWDMGQYTTLDGKTATGCRLDRAKVQVLRAINQLTDKTKLDVAAYDCEFRQWIPTAEPADVAHRAGACAWVDALQPQGATGTGPAVLAAASLGGKHIVLLTDGAPNCGAGDGYGDTQCVAAHRQMIAAGLQKQWRVDVFGIGATGAFAGFCADVASDNGGTYVPVQ